MVIWWLGDGSGVEAPKIGLNSSVGEGTVVYMAEETSCVQRVGKLRGKLNKREYGKAVGKGVGKPGGVKSRVDLSVHGIVSVFLSRWKCSWCWGSGSGFAFLSDHLAGWIGRGLKLIRVMTAVRWAMTDVWIRMGCWVWRTNRVL